MYVTYKYVLVLSIGHFFCRFRVTGKKSEKFVASQNLSFGETLKVHTSNKDSLTPEGVSRYWPKVIWESSRSEMKSAKFMSSLLQKFFYGESLKILTLQRNCFWPEVVPLCRVCLKTVKVSRSHTDEGSDGIDFYLEKNNFFTWIWNLLFTSPFVGKRNPSKFRKTSKSIFFSNHHA